MITQLEGPKKTLRLEGWSAPMGRPRKGAVVTDGIAARHSETYYDGNNVPTRHVFGTRLDPFQLHGRFRDRADGKDFAKKKTAEVQSFVDDLQSVQITWDDIIDVNGFVAHFEPGRESRGEVEWRLEIRVDRNNFADRKPPTPTPRSPVDYMNLIKAFLTATDLPTTNLTGALTDLVDGVLGPFESAMNAMDTVANAVSSFETMTAAQLSRFGSTVSRARATAMNAKEVVTNIPASAALVRNSATEAAAFHKSQSGAEEALRAIVALMAEMTVAADRARAGRKPSSYRAKQGDTWQSISSAQYGSPDRAAEVMFANGVAGGAAPIPGVEYLIPA